MVSAGQATAGVAVRLVAMNRARGRARPQRRIQTGMGLFQEGAAAGR